MRFIENNLDWFNKYASVATWLQVAIGTISIILAVIAICFAVKAIKETRVLSTKKSLKIFGGLFDESPYIFYLTLYNDGYAPINISSILVNSVSPIKYQIMTGISYNNKLLIPKQALAERLVFDLYDNNVKSDRFEIVVRDLDGYEYTYESEYAFG